MIGKAIINTAKQYIIDDSFVEMTIIIAIIATVLILLTGIFPLIVFREIKKKREENNQLTKRLITAKVFSIISIIILAVSLILPAISASVMIEKNKIYLNYNYNIVKEKNSTEVYVYITTEKDLDNLEIKMEFINRNSKIIDTTILYCGDVNKRSPKLIYQPLPDKLSLNVSNIESIQLKFFNAKGWLDTSPIWITNTSIILAMISLLLSIIVNLIKLESQQEKAIKCIACGSDKENAKLCSKCKEKLGAAGIQIKEENQCIICGENSGNEKLCEACREKLKNANLSITEGKATQEISNNTSDQNHDK